MRINEPVTNIEHVMEDGDVILSKTDVKGLITYVNRTFCKYAMMSDEELIGQPHNIIRHPGMPAVAFQDLWETLNKGRPWTGVVKNRCKNGDFYWVEANVTPIHEHDQLIGYTSFRTKPSRDQVRVADALYRDIREGKPLKVKVLEGQAVRKGFLGWLSRFLEPSTRGRLLFGFSILLIVCMSLGLKGLHGLIVAGEGLETGLHQQILPMRHLKTIDDQYAHGILNISFQVSNGSLGWEQGIQALDNAEKLLTENWAAYQQTVRPQETEAMTIAIQAMEKARAAAKNLREAMENHDRETLTTLLKSGAHQSVMNFEYAIETLYALRVTGAQLNFSEVISMNRVATWSVIIGLSMFFVITILLARSIVGGLMGKFKKAIDVTQSVSAGNFNQEIDTTANDEFGRLMRALKNMVGNVGEIAGDVKTSANSIATASREIATGNTDLSQRTEEQASSLEETASSMEEMTSVVKQNAGNAHQAKQLANEARETAEKGGEVVTRAVSAMDEINNSSNKIADIIGVIDEIAFQTNLLALNAAVEAARAGEQGLGFAVVAAEVRNLAQRSATAAKEIKDLINDSVEKVTVGSKLVDKSGETLAEIVQGIKKVSDIVSEISAASQEQSAGINQVNNTMMLMDEMTQQNAALVEQVTASSKAMEDQVQVLSTVTTFFSVGGSELDKSAAAVKAARRTRRQKKDSNVTRIHRGKVVNE